MENMYIHQSFRTVLIITLFCTFQACDGEKNNINDNEPDASVDAGDSDVDTGEMGEGFTCVECHIDEELLIADLEANPLPEPDEDPESEGEG